MRCCSNTLCRKPIVECFGTTKAGDYNELILGTRRIEHVRELCPKCATRLIILMDIVPQLQPMLFAAVGWHNDRLLPKPA